MQWGWLEPDRRGSSTRFADEVTSDSAGHIFLQLLTLPMTEALAAIGMALIVTLCYGSPLAALPAHDGSAHRATSTRASDTSTRITNGERDRERGLLAAARWYSAA